MRTRRLRCALVACLVALGPAVWPALAADPLSGLKPAEPQPPAAQLTPGLAVRYGYAIVNSIGEFAKKGGGKWEPGPPLPTVDYKTGSGKVLTSKESDGVLAVIEGLIRFDKPGVYGFDVTSNDGVRVEIGGQLVYEDDSVHADDTSERIDVKVDAPGWYPIQIHYFEKRNTSTLILRWIGPGEKGKLQPVPARALAHVKK
jgi:hypothetical protein